MSYPNKKAYKEEKREGKKQKGREYIKKKRGKKAQTEQQTNEGKKGGNNYGKKITKERNY